MQPPIKWTGSKRSQAKEILARFPNKIDTYYEPFCGGASIMLALLESNIQVGQFICSDQNKELIALWKLIRDFPEKVLEDYARKHAELVRSEDKQTYYLEVRGRFNLTKDPLDFFFLNRTAFNGLIRYNRKGEFNSAFHFSRNGIEPSKITKILANASKLLREKNVAFLNISYLEINPSNKDFMYLDPPYFATTGMYHGGLCVNELSNYLRNLKCSYALSYDGSRKGENLPIILDKDLYTEHYLAKAAKSAFCKLQNQSVEVKESLYIKRK